MHKHESRFTVNDVVCYKDSRSSSSFPRYAKIIAIRFDNEDVSYQMSDMGAYAERGCYPGLDWVNQDLVIELYEKKG